MKLLSKIALLPRITKEGTNKHFGVSSAPACLPLIDNQTNKKKDKRSKKTLLPLDIDLSKIVFSHHALWRLAQWTFILGPEFQTSLGLKEVAEKMFAGSTEKNAIEPAVKVKRCITHHFQEARYFRNQGWRFVVLKKEEQFLVVTIERVRGYDSKPNEIRTLADVMPEDE